MSITISKHYKKALLTPFIVVLFSNIIYFAVIIIFREVQTSEWLDTNSMVFIATMIVVLNAIIILVLSLSIFLNKHKIIKQNLVLSFATWFLPASIWIFYILGKEISHYINTEIHTIEDSIFVLANTIPYLIAIAWTFYKYRKEYKNLEKKNM